MPVDSSMVRTSNRAAWSCADSPRSNALRLTTCPVYTLRRLDFHLGDPLLYPCLQGPAPN